MPELVGYTVGERLRDWDQAVLLRGRRLADGQAVLIKLPWKHEPTSAARLRWEYQLACSLAAREIVPQPLLIDDGSIVALVVEDSQAILLRQWPQQPSPSPRTRLAACLEIATQLAQALVCLHGQGLIHCDLRPERLMIHPHTLRLRLLDCGSTQLVSATPPAAPPPAASVGAVQFLSPEQTGHLPRPADQRSDLYALGLICYELLTGELPWREQTALGWLHAQVALPPRPPRQLLPEIPEVVSALVLRLLAKMPEERYQSALGLLHDLSHCRRQLQEGGQVISLQLGMADPPVRPRLPQQLFGRENELGQLRDAYAVAQRGERAAVFVSGPAGMGKTALIMRAIREFDGQPGLTICGKFDQLQSAAPYAAFTAALRDLTKQLLTGDPQELAEWTQRLIRALGRNGGLVTALVPELTAVIGPQPTPEELPPQEAQNRFLLVVVDLLRALARRGQPLVWFLDDLQWADSASLQLLNYLLQATALESLLLIGSVRENELAPAHPLRDMLQADQLAEPSLQLVRLSPLTAEQARRLVAAMLCDQGQQAGPLAEQLVSKSGGNPLLLSQLLLEIWEAGLLRFDHTLAAWRWQPEQIQQLPLRQDVLELFLERLRRVPSEALQLLQWAACWGNRFDLFSLSGSCGQPLGQVADCLLPASQAGLILALPESRGQQPVWEFMHDRVQQAVYAGMPPDQQKRCHLAIARWLLAVADGREERTLLAADHFRRSWELLSDPAERLQVAAHQLQAGLQAKATGAYAAAHGYLCVGRQLLPTDAWQSAYQLWHDLHLELAQMEYLSDHLSVADELFDQVIAAAPSRFERTEVRCCQVVLQASRGQYAVAVRTGIGALAELGIQLPLPPSWPDYARELAVYRRQLSRCLQLGTTVAASHTAGDRLQTLICELLARLACIISIHDPKAYLYMIAKFSNHAVRYGDHGLAAIGYLGYGIIAGSLFGRFAVGQSLAATGLQLAEAGGSYEQCYANFVMGAIICHWRQPLSIGREYLQRAVEHGQAAGDLLLTGYACRFRMEHAYLSGQSLEVIADRVVSEQAQATSLRHEYLALNCRLYHQLVSCLQGAPGHPLTLSAFDFDEASFIQSMQRDQASQAAYYVLKLQLAFWAGDWPQAWAAAELATERLAAVTGFLITAEFGYYQSLLITATPQLPPPAEERRRQRLLKLNRRQLRRWAEHCPQNFRQKYLLVEAEAARRRGRWPIAITLYDQAIAWAERHGYQQDAALACELAAGFHREQGRAGLAQAYFEQACRGYAAWGAAAKVTSLRQRYPQLVALPAEQSLSAAVAPTSLPPSAAGSLPMTPIDLAVLRQAMQSVAAADDLDEMLQAFLAFALSCAGADKAALVLEQHGNLRVAAMRHAGDQPAAPARSTALARHRDLSWAVVRFVFRTLEITVFNPQQERTAFSTDLYLAQAGVQSVACLPINLAETPVGVVYLENSLLADAFRSERLELLTLLAAQLLTTRQLQDYRQASAADLLPTAPLAEALTGREQDVLRLIAAGLSVREIADHLGLTANTVKGYLKNVYGKLGANRRVQVVARAQRLGLLSTASLADPGSDGGDAN